MHYMVQALRAVSHNYPDLMLVSWGQISAIVHKFLRRETWKEQAGNTVVFVGEKMVTAAIKVRYPLSIWSLFNFLFVSYCMFVSDISD